jgi:pimeloyl-ACP methyl ester carboxylesterase
MSSGVAYHCARLVENRLWPSLCSCTAHGTTEPARNGAIPHLEGKGHKTFAPTIAGHGNGVDKNVDHSRYTKSIVDYVVERSLEGLVLVGHSFGDTIISKVAEDIPDRIRRMIFLSGFVVRDGRSLLDEIPPHHASLFKELVMESSDGRVTLPFLIWRDAFVNDADLELAKSTYEQLSTEPFQLIKDKLDLKKFYSLDIPNSYINCSEDTALPPGEWGWHPRMSGRLALYRLVQMPGGQEVIFTNPEGLADKILEAGRD